MMRVWHAEVFASPLRLSCSGQHQRDEMTFAQVLAEIVDALRTFGPIAFAGFLGGLIGLEREFAGKPAGLRTHVFVGAGSALLVLLGGETVDAFAQSRSKDVIEADPVRIIQAIVVGISFLGAGTIVHHRDHNVEGLTTAASIYLTAAIGVAVGVWEFFLAGITAAFALLVLFVAGRVEQRFMREPDKSRSASRDSSERT